MHTGFWVTKLEDRSRCRWKDTIIEDIEEMRLHNANRIDLVQDGVMWLVFVNAVMNLQVPQSEGRLLNSPETISYSAPWKYFP
jgi:hypothetical protein